MSIKIGIGRTQIFSGGGSGGGVAFSAEYQAVYNAMAAKPSAADIAIQSTWLDAMVAAGYYAKAEFLDLFSADTQANSLFNWRDPAGAHNPSLVNAPAFTAYGGFTGNSAGVRCVRTHFIPTVDATVMSMNSHCLMIGVANNVAEDIPDAGSWIDAATNCLYIFSKGSSNEYYMRAAGTTLLNVANASSIGHYAVSRRLATEFDGYKNFTKTNKVGNSVVLTTNEIYACGCNNTLAGVVASNKTLRYCFLFSGLTEAEVNGVVTLTEAYLDNYGTGLI